jgi:hypothetical protein
LIRRLAAGQLFLLTFALLAANAIEPFLPQVQPSDQENREDSEHERKCAGQEPDVVRA